LNGETRFCGCERSTGAGYRLRHYILVPSYRHPFPLDVRRAQRVDDVIRNLIGDFDEREPIVNLDGTDNIGVELQLVRYCADNVAGPDLGLAASADVDLGNLPAGLALGAGDGARRLAFALWTIFWAIAWTIVLTIVRS